MVQLHADAPATSPNNFSASAAPFRTSSLCHLFATFSTAVAVRWNPRSPQLPIGTRRPPLPRAFAPSRLRANLNPLTSNPQQSSRTAPVHIGRGLVRSVSNVCCKLRQGRPGLPIGKRCEILGVRRSGFFVLPPSLPVISSLGEDAGEEGFAGFKGRVGTDCLRRRGLHLCLRAPDAG